MLSLSSSSSPSATLLPSSLDLSDLSRCLPGISLSLESLSHSYATTEIRSKILNSLTAPPVKHDLLLLCSRLSQDNSFASAATRQSYADILVTVGSLAAKCLSANGSSEVSSVERNALLALRQHSESALAVLQAMAMTVTPNSQEERSLLLSDLSAFHHRHPLLVLLSRELLTDCGERVERAARAVSMSGNYLRQGVSHEEFQAQSQLPFRCSASATSLSEETKDHGEHHGKGHGHEHTKGKGKGQCHCDEALLSHGTDLVSLYCESVATHSFERIAAATALCGAATGAVESRSTPSHRKDLLRAIFYDPSRLSSWTALVGVMYADGVLGSSLQGAPQRQQQREQQTEPSSVAGDGGDEDFKEEQKELPSAAADDKSVSCGCFADEESLPICAKISLFLAKHSFPGTSVPPLALASSSVSSHSNPLRSLSSLLLFHLTTPLSDPPPELLPLDWISSELNHLIHLARQEVRQRHFSEAVTRYRLAIDTLRATLSSSSAASASSVLSLAIQLSYEAAQVLSHHLLLPEEAEILFKQCATFHQQLPAVKPRAHLAVAYDILTALAYLHRHLASSSSSPSPVSDAQRAQEILQSRCLSLVTGTLPAQVRAVCQAIHGYLWECQGKTKKALADYAAARETFPGILFPFPPSPSVPASAK
jgi:hypothetical protein